jgi:hypothetical protein
MGCMGSEVQILSSRPFFFLREINIKNIIQSIVYLFLAKNTNHPKLGCGLITNPIYQDKPVLSSTANSWIIGSIDASKSLTFIDDFNDIYLN